jgi:hypothetical protein
VFVITSPKDADWAGSSTPWIVSISTAPRSRTPSRRASPPAGCHQPSRHTACDDRGVYQHLEPRERRERCRAIEHLHRPDHGRALPVVGRLEPHDQRVIAVASP